IMLEVHSDGEDLHELPADKHLRCSGIGGGIEDVEGLVVDGEIADGNLVDVNSLCLTAAADSTEGDGLLFDLQAKLLCEACADDVHRSGVEDCTERPLVVDLHLKDQTALGRYSDLTRGRHDVTEG